MQNNEGNKIIHTPACCGQEFAWKSDHAYVKISSEQSGGVFSLIEDNLTLEFRLPKHLHRIHTETFYVVSGRVEFKLENKTIILAAGDTLFIPQNEPHAAQCLEPAKMLTLYQPGGLEKLFEAYARMTLEEMADMKKVRAIEVMHDTIVLD